MFFDRPNWRYAAYLLMYGGLFVENNVSTFPLWLLLYPSGQK